MVCASNAPTREWPHDRCTPNPATRRPAFTMKASTRRDDFGDFTMFPPDIDWLKENEWYEVCPVCKGRAHYCLRCLDLGAVVHNCEPPPYRHRRIRPGRFRGEDPITSAVCLLPRAAVRPTSDSAPSCPPRRLGTLIAQLRCGQSL